MLRQALNALKHGLEHLKQGSASDRGFAFEHIDQAAELLVKEKARQLGETIYRQGHESISLYEAKRKLDQRHVDIQSWSAVEVVREQRDTIHHDGYVPDEDTTEVYLNDVMPFFDTFLRDQFGLDLIHILENAGITPPGQPARPADRLLSEAARTAKTQPRMSVMSAATAVELAARPLVAHPQPETLALGQVGRLLEQSGIWTGEDLKTFKVFMQVRNRAAHSGADPSETEATFAVEAAKGWVDRLGRASKKSD